MSHHHVLLSLVLITLSLSTFPSISGICTSPPVPLVDGVSTVMDAPDTGFLGSAYYFSFIPSPPSGSPPTQLTIALTMISGGYAEIYVLPSDSVDPQCPTKSTRDVITPADGIFRATVSGTLRKYWITVYVKNAAEFSVTATYASATTLIDGVPQAGRASATSTPVEWFKVRFPTIKKVPNTNTENKIRFSLVPVRGNAFFYVSSTANQPSGNTPNTISSTNSLAAQNEVIWDFSDSHFARPTDGWFYIGVQGVTYCQFVFTAHQYYTNAYLTPGLPQRTSLNAREWHYYVTRIENPSCKLTVVVTPFSGDPDLFSSATYLQPNSSRFTYDRSSTRATLNDSVVYTTTVQDGEYGIGVYGYSTTSYSIVSVVDCVGDNTTDIAYLIMGQPQEGTLATGQSMWYRVSVVDKHHDIQFSITIENNGDPDIYISTRGIPRFNASENSRSTYTWSGENYGNDVVLIPHDIDDHENPLYCPTEHDDYCDYFIQVYAFAGCSYTLTVTQSQAITQLRNGISMHEDLGAGQYEYFTMYLDQPNQALTVSVTDLGRGDPDVFINVLTNFSVILEPSMFPTLSNPASYKWLGRAFGADTVIVPPAASAIPQLFLIAVHAWTSTSFSIVATFNRSISLSPGIPQAGNISASKWVYYEYISNPTDPNDEAVSFVLQTSVGRADMYVSRNNYPTFANFEMLRRWNQVPQKLDVNHTLASTCEKPCRWFIGIWGNALSTAYTLTVHAGTNVQLINGQPASDTLLNNQYAYYEIFVPRNQYPNQTLDLNVIVTTLSGDPDMYMTNATDGTRPTNRIGTYRWSATRFGGDSIDIEQVRPGTYTLGILCLGNCSYTVLSVLSTETPDDLSIVTLYDGQPQRVFVPRNHWRYFSMDHTMDFQSTTQVTYTLTPDYGDPDLYVKYNGDGKLPNLTSYDARAFAAGSSVDVIRLDHPVPTVHLIGVHSYQTTMFTLLGSVVRDDLPIPTQPTDGEKITVNNTTPLWTFFEMENVEGKSLTVKLIAKSRDTPMILGSVDTMYPRENDYIWKGSRLPSIQRTYAMTIDTTDPRFTTGYYYIGIKGGLYDVTFSFGETRGLQDGVALAGFANGGVSQYFTFRVSNTTNQNVVVRASPCSGSIALYMDQNEKQPGPRTAATWTDKRKFSEKEIVISNGKFASTNFYVGVYGISDSSYEIRADNDNVEDIIPDVASVPGTSDVISVTATATSVTLSFYPAVSKLGADSLQYEIRYTQDVNTVMDTSCGAQQATFGRKVDIPTGNINQTTSVTVDGLQPSSLYRFTIVVNDYTIGAPQRNVYQPTSRIYTPAESAVITEGDSSSGSLKLLLGLGIPAFLLLAAGVVFLVIRNRRLTKELEVEMHDVPKGVLRRAVGRGVALEETDEEKAARTSRPFTNLLTDGDRSDAPTTEDPDAYNPPDYARQL